MQNFEKILSRTSSQSVLPTISPSASSASERSEAVSSAGADSIILSLAHLRDCLARDKIFAGYFHGFNAA